ncbi:proline-rich receptor protein kinase PERK4 [Trifolium repens]|nr:proline-rich receptor protein kinase PERK4 [Trifolium repens]
MGLFGLSTIFVLMLYYRLCSCLRRRREATLQQPPPPQEPEGPVRRQQEAIEQQRQQSPPPEELQDFVVDAKKFTFEELACATDGFASHNLLGQGGFGFVHRGILDGGCMIAVKQLKDRGDQGEREFQAEVEIINRVYHKHIVSFIGYCNDDHHRLLVFEFVDNKTLHFHLHGAGSALDWQTRFKIAVGCAKGLEYLHEHCDPMIIHRDIKAENILLDSNFEAKIADFGLAKRVHDAYTHVSTRSDVYSFGVILLELLTTRRPVYHDQSINLVQWATPFLVRAIDGDLDSFIDPRLLNNHDPVQIIRMVTCAAACTRRMPKSRPRMSQVVGMLEGNHPLNEIKEEIKQEIIHRESSSVYVSAEGEFK